jgi:hypothetical protein
MIKVIPPFTLGVVVVPTNTFVVASVTVAVVEGAAVMVTICVD